MRVRDISKRQNYQSGDMSQLPVTFWCPFQPFEAERKETPSWEVSSFKTCPFPFGFCWMRRAFLLVDFTAREHSETKRSLDPKLPFSCYFAAWGKEMSLVFAVRNSSKH